jgi:flavin-dependent dehydrogenase
VLYERERLPRHKTCGGGVVVRARHALPPLDESAFECGAARASLHMLCADGRELEFDPEPAIPVALALRARLDHELAKLAAAAGARLRDGEEVLAVRIEREHVEIATARETTRVRRLLIADGATGATARRAGWRSPHRGAAALEWELDVSERERARWLGRARFDFGDVERGYAWVFGKRERLSVGVLVTAREPGSLAHELELYLARLSIEPHAIERHGYVVPLQPRQEGPTRGPVWLLGDAAGLADPLTAEGISHAALSARLAARAIAERDDLEASAKRYRALLDEHVLAELRWARRLARLLESRRTREWLFTHRGAALVHAMASVISGRASYRSLIRDPRNFARLAFGVRRARDAAAPAP